jgi:hypothetical protein
MRHTETDDACLTGRGSAHAGRPPLSACRRRFVAAVAIVACVVVGSACTSSHADSGTTPKPTALVIPPPFEIHQQVGFGSVTILVDSFRRDGDALTVDVAVKNETQAALPPGREPAFSVFFDTGLHQPSAVTGGARPIPPNGSVTLTLDFAVPAKYRYPLLWFASAASGVGPDDVILRGAHS